MKECYNPVRSSACDLLTLRGQRHCVREWPATTADAPTLFWLHGWADVSITFQFLVDCLPPQWRIIAPDLRGFGGSGRSGGTYWFADYLADLEALLAHYLAADEKAILAGHSLGGNVVSLYAGIRPQRVAAVIALDAFGLGDSTPQEAPARYARWLDQTAQALQFKTFADFDALAARLHQNTPQLAADKLNFLALNLGERGSDGRVHLAMDPAHRNISPILYRGEEARACWRAVRAPVLWLVQADPAWRRALGVDDDLYDRVRACFADLEEVAIADSGHNLHHEQPAAVAQAVSDFLTRRLALAA